MAEQDQTILQTNVTDELGAMKIIAEALDSLDGDTRERVLQWAANRFMPSLENARVIGLHSPVNNNLIGTSNSAGSSKQFADLPSLFEAANPSTEVEKALVVGYWCQEIEGSGDFGSQAINTELKHLGHAVSNITAAFTTLIKGKYVLQIKKSGKSQQARKRYKLTLTGIKKIEEMLTQKVAA